MAATAPAAAAPPLISSPPPSLPIPPSCRRYVPPPLLATASPRSRRLAAPPPLLPTPPAGYRLAAPLPASATPSALKLGRASSSGSWIRDKASRADLALPKPMEIPGRASLSEDWVLDKLLARAGSAPSSSGCGKRSCAPSAYKYGKKPSCPWTLMMTVYSVGLNA